MAWKEERSNNNYKLQIEYKLQIALKVDISKLFLLKFKDYVDFIQGQIHAFLTSITSHSLRTLSVRTFALLGAT